MADREVVKDVQPTTEAPDHDPGTLVLGGLAVGSESPGKPESSDIKYLIETAKRLTSETRVPHGVKTDIHGHPTVVRYGRNGKLL